jgi:hypothetical protein
MENINPSNLICDVIYGIDPGKGGAIAKFKQGEKIEVVKMPEFNDLCDYFDYQLTICKNPMIVIEKVQVRPGDEVGGKQYAIEKMLRQYTELLTVIKTRKIQYVECHPMTWQSYLKIKMGGEDRQTRKRRYCDIAKEMYPSLKVTLQNCDALLLVQFARQKLLYDKLWIIQNLKKPLKERDLFK